MIGILLRLGDHKRGRLSHASKRRFECSTVTFGYRVDCKAGQQIPERGATVAQNFATNQIECLDTIGAFIDLPDPGIPHNLLDTPLADVAMAAEHLLRHDCAIKTAIGQKRFCNWRQKFASTLSRFIVGIFREVQLQPDEHRKCAAGFRERADGQQHAPDIRMHKQRVRRSGWILRTSRRSTLEAISGVSRCLLIGQFSRPETLQTH